MSNKKYVFDLCDYTSECLSGVPEDRNIIWESMINYARSIRCVPSLENRYGYIYATRNVINGKVYIGKRSKPEIDVSYTGSGKQLVQAVKKYGREKFITVVLQWGTSNGDLNLLEKSWIKRFNAIDSAMFYNLSEGGTGFGTGRNNPRHRSRVDVSGEKNPMYGRKHTDISNELNRLHNLGNVRSKESIEKQKETYRKNKHVRTEEYRRRLSESLKGRKLSEETKIKSSDIHKRLWEELPEEEKIRRINRWNSWKSDPIKFKNAMIKIAEKTGKRVVRVEDMHVFRSVKEASRSVEVGNVVTALRKVSRYAGGYHWIYESEVNGRCREEILKDIKEEVERDFESKTRRKKTLCVDTGIIYDSASEAATKNNMAECTLINSIRLGKRAKGLKFVYVTSVGGSVNENNSDIAKVK